MERVEQICPSRSCETDPTRPALKYKIAILNHGDLKVYTIDNKGNLYLKLILARTSSEHDTPRPYEYRPRIGRNEERSRLLYVVVNEQSLPPSANTVEVTM